MTRLASVAGRAVRRPAVAAALVFALAWALLEMGHPPCPTHGDTHEDLLLARACVEEGRCPTVGVNTRMPGVSQGALWISLLAVLRAVPVSVGAIHSLTFALAAAGVALLFATLRRRSTPLASATAALTLAGLLYGETLHVPWNPSLTPLPAALLLVVALDHAERGRWWGALPLGLALGLTLETHPVALLLAPGATLVAGLGSERRAAALLSPALTGAIALGTYAAISPDAARGNAATAIDRMGWAIAVGAVGVSAAALFFHERFRRADARTRTLVAALALSTLPLVVVAAWTATQPRFDARYAVPALPALAYALAAGIGRGARSPAPLWALTACALVAISRSPREAHDEPPLAALEAAGQALHGEGMTLDEAFARVGGPGCADVIGALAATGMPMQGPASELPRESLILTMAAELEGGAARDLERGRWRTIPTAWGDVLVGELPTWVDRRRMSACVFSERGEELTCVERDLAGGVRALMSIEEDLTRLADPTLQWSEDPRRELASHRVVYTLPVRVPPGAGERTLSVPRAARDCRAARFLAVEGVRARGALPAASVTLESARDEQEGSVTIEITACGDDSLPLFPPCLTEIAPTDGAALRRILDG